MLTLTSFSLAEYKTLRDDQQIQKVDLAMDILSKIRSDAEDFTQQIVMQIYMHDPDKKQLGQQLPQGSKGLIQLRAEK